ncbi:hypothetical protein [Nonomuraea turcica]|uniref:hypothetical protein n=1 Tax=Nonomuraea sp. G32 TaxID=3067274 RepID=UPI00273CC2EA|nr:hypothetical protein [Nonomuraea sp. G32]MDP4512011.1 hypothetical protein [Nonomuraea sp. G32]
MGKSTIGRLIVQERPCAAFIDIDDVRHLVVSGHAAPWNGLEGLRQQRLGVLNGCALARNFLDGDIDVVIVDVLTDSTAELYRASLPDVLILKLEVDFRETEKRAETRPVYLTPEEFGALHDQQHDFTGSDIRVDVTRLSTQGAAAQVKDIWLSDRG